VYHVLNRRVGRLPLFDCDADFEAFEHVLVEAHGRTPSLRVLAYVLMGNHWHLLLQPARAKDLVSPTRFQPVRDPRQLGRRLAACPQGCVMLRGRDSRTVNYASKSARAGVVPVWFNAL